MVMNIIIIKIVSCTEPPDTIALYHALIITPLALIPTLFVWVTPSAEQFLWLLCAGGLSLLVERSMVRGFAAADATWLCRLVLSGCHGRLVRFRLLRGGTRNLGLDRRQRDFASSIFITKRENVAERRAECAN